jgi:hypothetical protein
MRFIVGYFLQPIYQDSPGLTSLYLLRITEGSTVFGIKRSHIEGNTSLAAIHIGELK